MGVVGDGLCYTTGAALMGNIGFGELAIICIVLIIAVGPERLPSMMKTLGKTMRTLRQASRDIRASTGIDELMREDFDIAPAPRRPFIQQPVEGPPVGRDAQVADETALTSAAADPALTSAAADPALTSAAAIEHTPTPHATAAAPEPASAAPSQTTAEPDPSKHGA